MNQISYIKINCGVGKFRLFCFM